MIFEVLASSVIGSILWMDRVYVFQFMLSRPIIMAPILGLVFGDVQTGLLTGACLELLWLNSPPVGSFLPEDESFCAAVATPVACYAASTMVPSAAVGLSLVLSMPSVFIGKAIDTYQRRSSEALVDVKESDKLDKYIGKKLGKALVLALFRVFSAIFILSLVLVVLVRFVGPSIPKDMCAALAYIPYLSITIGLASLVRTGRSLRLDIVSFLMGMITVFAIEWIR
ncbi:MAG: PTS sugar transporter subunit IIC [Deltaproteobacteria bacterium]|nr:PTS sugar transporter subunit IIC [Deltaproteobacteria bacterium]